MAIKNAREMALLPYANRVTQQRGGRDRGNERGIRADGPPPRPTARPPVGGDELGEEFEASRSSVATRSWRRGG
jgi:hypothetical protein